MTDTPRTVLISTGVSLLAVVIVPLLVCLAMMVGMDTMSSNGDMMDRMTGTAWIPIGIVLLILIAGAVLLRPGIRHR